jgi:hypothetical protein
MVEVVLEEGVGGVVVVVAVVVVAVVAGEGRVDGEEKGEEVRWVGCGLSSKCRSSCSNSGHYNSSLHFNSYAHPTDCSL